MVTTEIVASLSNPERYLLKSLAQAEPLEAASWGKRPQDPHYAPDVLATGKRRLRQLGLVEEGSEALATVQTTRQGRDALAAYEQREGQIIMSVSVTAGPVADILVADVDLQPIAIVEVKNRQDLSRDVARSLYRSLLAHGARPAVPYFLLVSQDRGFLWTEVRPGDTDGPVLDFPMSSVVMRYASEYTPPGRLRGKELEQLVAHWLLDLTDVRDDIKDGPDLLLREAGFIGAIQGAIVITDPYV